jgi:hypothetical protein
MQNSIQSKRFVIRKSLIGQNTIIEVTFKNGNSFNYNHDKAYELMSENLDHLSCWLKYKSYTSSTSIPKALQNTEVL